MVEGRGAKIIREIERNLSKIIGRDNLELIRDLLEEHLNTLRGKWKAQYSIATLYSKMGLGVKYGR